MSLSVEELALKSLHEWWGDVGVSVEKPAIHRKSSSPSVTQTKTQKKPAPTQKAPRILRSDPINDAVKLAKQAQSIDELKQAVSQFEGCDLKMSARSTVLFDGNPAAKIMVIGEAPGRDEDMAGKPFVGRSGQLLDKMLKAIELDRERNIYITNIIPWHPPGNRNPDPAEIALCRPFLHRQIELLSPSLLIAVGKFSAHTLLNETDSILRLRGRKLTYNQENLGTSIPCIPILHPAYLLRRPAEKSKAWRDMLIIQTALKELGLT